MRRLVALALVVSSLAGCTSLQIPDDAASDSDPALPTATMHAWTENFDDFIRVSAVFSDGSGDLLKVEVREPYGPWRINITTDAGQEVIFDDRAACHFPWPEVRGPNVHDELRFTWTQETFGRFADCRSGESLVGAPAAAGNYTATVRFTLSDLPDDAFMLQLPFQLS